MVTPTPLTAALAGVFSSLAMPLLWPRLEAGSTWLVLAFVLLVALPAHAFVVGFRRSEVPASKVDTALLKRVGAWLAATGLALLVTWALR
jgi:hypothetical protein